LLRVTAEYGGTYTPFDGFVPDPDVDPLISTVNIDKPIFPGEVQYFYLISGQAPSEGDGGFPFNDPEAQIGDGQSPPPVNFDAKALKNPVLAPWSSSADYTSPITEAPEPGTLLLLGTGMLFLGAIGRKRIQK